MFGRYRNPYTDDPAVAGRDRTVATTTSVWHAGRLFMTKEDGLGYEIDPDTLATIGRWDYGGALKSPTFTAHPRVDPVIGEMFFFGYEAGGLCSRDIAYCIADRDGQLVAVQWFKVAAGDIAAGAVARVPVPVRMRPQVHGARVSEGQLAARAAPIAV